jgi:hypothetical protein
VIVRLLAAALSFASALSYVELREGAVAVERPSSAIALLIGACDKGDFVDQTQCQENTKGDRKKIEGKRVVLNLGAGHENMLDFAQLNGDVARFVWTPLYDAGNGLAITVGKPTKVSPQGTIVMNRRPFDGKVADDVTDSDLKRAAKLGQVGIEIVGTFGKPWTLQHGDKTLRGISFEIEGVRFYHSRTGKTLSEGPVSK